jgi:hypothetical protein
MPSQRSPLVSDPSPTIGTPQAGCPVISVHEATIRWASGH